MEERCNQMPFASASQKFESTLDFSESLSLPDFSDLYEDKYISFVKEEFSEEKSQSH
jgi:hypothetical protein